MASGDLRSLFVVYCKGLCMGMADSVPGVSGGTIALITGIYDRLIGAISSLDPRVLSHLARIHTHSGRAELKTALLDMDVPFLIALGLGMVTAVVGVAELMQAAITNYPTATAAFFFGLIIAAAIVLYQYVSIDTPARLGAAVLGVSLAVVVAGATKNGAEMAPMPMLFGVGALALSAMVLPGVSGAFVLYLFGQYESMTAVPGKFIDALVAYPSTGDASALIATGTPVVVFVGGGVVGVLTIAHLLTYLLENYHVGTLTFLVSLMVGSLRAPAQDIAANVGDLSPALLALTAISGLVGAGLVFILDRYTDDIEFGNTEPTQPPPETERTINH
ncbi:DUF368 domain-containing protein [Halocatena halophila]|uniref:DUF368 domain-containing protein n=1 Tax=Halocatena halophila TaxID=2814576 RepID=UPI002ED048A7